MTVLKYLEEKNRLIRAETGLKLIPKNQLVNFNRKDTKAYKTYLKGSKSRVKDMDICPYCWKFKDCKDCPMENMNNNCMDTGSTYSKCSLKLLKIEDIRGLHDVKGMKELVKKFKNS